MPLVLRILCVIATLFLLTGCEKKQQTFKPNLVLISIDTLRADHLSCYGYNRPTSPTLDKIASEGLLFEDASATSPWTLPSHGTLLTGFYPGQIGLNNKLSKLPSEIETLATVLSRHFFVTGAIVNSIYLSQKYGLSKGFDYFHYIPESYTTTGVAPIIINQSIQWMQKHINQQFFLFLHFYDVHSDYRSLPQYEKDFVSPYHGVVDGTNKQLLLVREGEIVLNKVDTTHLSDLYDAGIRQLDDQLKKLFDFLRQEVLLKKTFIIITSDHGEEFLEHGKILHSQTHYQEAVHIPLIIHGPGIPRSRKMKEVVSLVDVMPTVLSLLGIPRPSSLAGLDLCPLWQKDNSKALDRFIFIEADKKNVRDDIKRVVRKGTYKLHYNLLTKESEFYDLTNDPKERFNIISEFPSLVEVLFAELKKFMKTSKRSKQYITLTPDEIKKLKRLGYL